MNIPKTRKFINRKKDYLLIFPTAVFFERPKTPKFLRLRFQMQQADIQAYANYLQGAAPACGNA